MYISTCYYEIRDFYIRHTMRYYNKYVLKRSHRTWLFIQYKIQLDPVASILTIMPTQECFNGAVTILVHVAILVNMSTTMVPKTGNVMDFALFYVFLLVINTTFLCIYQEQCCFVSLFSVPCIMMEWFIQIQLNVLCY